MREGWEQVLHSDATGCFFQCSTCNKQTRVYNPQRIAVFICPHCQEGYNGKDRFFPAKKGKKIRATFPDTMLPLYCTGKLKGTSYTIVGCARKHEPQDQHAKWQEYTLLDDAGNYAFLSESYGHWILLRECEQPSSFIVDPLLSHFIHDDYLRYEMFSTYRQTTTLAAGEFPHDVKNVRKLICTEYIHPPHIFTCEKSDNQQTFFQGIYIPDYRIAEAFHDVPFTLPEQEGVGSCQPLALGIHRRDFITLSVLLVLCTLPLYLLWFSTNETRELTQLRANFTDSANTPVVVSPSFTVTGSRPTVVEFKVFTPMSNDWMDGNIVLVNEETGAEESFTAALEFYHGVTEGESWTEGSSHSTEYISGVVPGRYHVELEAYTSTSLSNLYAGKYMDVEVFQGASTPWNYQLFLIVLGLCTAIVGIGASSREKMRWGLDNER